MSGFKITGCHFHGHQYFLLALPRICACLPSGLYSGLPDYGKRSIPPRPLLFFTFLFARELFMRAYLHAVRGKRANIILGKIAELVSALAANSPNALQLLEHFVLVNYRGKVVWSKLDQLIGFHGMPHCSSLSQQIGF